MSYRAPYSSPRRLHPERGSYLYEGEFQTAEGEDIIESIRIEYTITPGYAATWEEPGAGDDVELDLPEGVVLSDEQTNEVRELIVNWHEWGMGDD